jgi:Transposase, Mutator family
MAVVEKGFQFRKRRALVAFERERVVGVGFHISRAMSLWQCDASAVTMHPASCSRTRVARVFPNEQSLLRLITAFLVETSDEWETGTIYLNMKPPTQPSV